MPYRRNDTVMREFEEMLKRLADTGNDAADAQEDLADATEQRVDDAGVSGSGEGGIASSFGAGAFAGFAGVAGFGGNVLSGAAGNFGAGASASDALEASALVQAKEYVQSNPEIFGNTIPGAAVLAGTGVAQAFTNVEQAGARAGNRLAELAEAGFDISQEDIDRTVALDLERVQRGNEVRARANASALSAENISSQVADANGQRILAVLERIAQNTALPGAFGGGAQ